MKNIILVNACNTDVVKPEERFALGLLSIATVLKEGGFATRIVSAGQFLANAAAFLADGPLYIGISAMTPQLPVALAIARKVRSLSPGAVIVWGGIHPTLFPEQTIASDLADIVIPGEGEGPAIALARCLASNGDLGGVDGIYYRVDEAVRKTKEAAALDIDKEPYLDYDHPDVADVVANPGDFSALHGPRGVKAVTVLAGRGCPYQCTFCINTTALKKKFRFKSAARLLDEIEYYVKRYGIGAVRFQDEEFFVSKKRLLEFLDGLEARKIRIAWTADVRANHFIESYITADLARRIRASGCFYWSLGVESASPRLLEKIKKRISLEQVVRAAEYSRDAGIAIGYGFLIGIPGETAREVKDSVRFAYRIWNTNTPVLIFSIFRPYPGSELYREAVSLGARELHTLEEWAAQSFYETGFMEVDDFPWVEDKAFVKLVKFTTNNVFARYSRSFGWLGWTHALRAIGIMRIRLNWWSFPVEYVLFNALRGMMKRRYIRGAIGRAF